jgi:hypothetical protein
VRKRSVVLVLATTLLTSGLMGLYWPLRITADFGASNPPDFERTLRARKRFKHVLWLQVLFWPALTVWFSTIDRATFDLFFYGSLIVVVANLATVYHSLANLAYTFIRAASSTGKASSYATCLLLSVLSLSVGALMQHSYNRFVAARR